MNMIMIHTPVCPRKTYHEPAAMFICIVCVFLKPPPHPKNSTTEGLKLCVGLASLSKNISGEVIKDGQRMCKDKSYGCFPVFQANVYPEDNRNTLTFSAHYFPFQAAKKAQKQTRKIPPICVCMDIGLYVRVRIIPIE